jgi:GT2 family glycosyltransferase
VSVPALITVFARAESAEEIDPILQTLASVRSTAPEAMVLVVDDRSPKPFADMIELAASELECAHVVQQDGAGREAAYNVGLTVAAEHGMDAVLIESGVILDSRGWLARLQARTGIDGQPAAVVGGAIVEQPTGLIRQAGYFFSVFRRTWGARLGCVPEPLLDVHQALVCPVSAELMLVRHQWIEPVGGFDELLTGANASLDYCLRTTQAGGECVLEPTVRGRALGTADGEPEEFDASARRLRVKHLGVSFQQWAPEVI